jgi:uncharacterized integral membrane protein (TIGR00697 family)
MRREKAFAFLLAIYVGGHVTANAVAAKLIDFGLGPFTVGALAYPLTYVLQDVISELYGEERARHVVLASFVGCLVLVAFSTLALAIPPAGADATGVCFASVFATTPRIVGASLAAFLLGGLVDVRMFFLIRSWTGPKKLWLRKLGSTVVGQAVDSTVFVLVAFAFVLPWGILAVMIGAQYALKLVCAIGGLPASYGAIAGVRRLS